MEEYREQLACWWYVKLELKSGLCRFQLIAHSNQYKIKTSGCCFRLVDPVLSNPQQCRAAGEWSMLAWLYFKHSNRITA